MTAEEVEFSLFISLSSPLMVSIIAELGFDYYQEAVKVGESLGFKAIFQPDHLMLPTTNFFYESWTVLAAAAACTKKMLIGSGVSPLTLHHPGILAKRVATLDHISGGRTIFGVGCGWYEKEYKAYGIPFDPYWVRMEKMLEGVELIKALWTKEGGVTYHGKYYSLINAELLPKPVQKPHPPIWFGGEKIQTLKAVAKHGQGWIPWELNPRVFKDRLHLLRRLTKKEGREPTEITPAVGVRTLVAPSTKEADAQFKRSRLQERGFPWNSEGKILVGSPKDCIAIIREWVDAGVKHFAISIYPPERLKEVLQLYSEEIIPKI